MDGQNPHEQDAQNEAISEHGGFPSENDHDFPEGTPGDSVMGMIVDVEGKIARLKRAHDEAKRASEELLQVRTELDESRSRVDSDREHLEELAKELEDREAELKAERERVEAREAAFEARESEYGERESRFAAREAETNELVKRFERERAEMHERVTRAEAEVDNRWKRIDEREERLRQEREATDQRLEEAMQRDAELCEREAKLRDQGIVGERVDELEQRLVQREKIITELRNQAERFDEELVSARDALLREGGAAEQLGEERRKARELREEVDDLRKQLERAGNPAEFEQAREQIEDLQAELEVARGKLEEIESAANEKVSTERETAENLRAELFEIAKVRDEAQSSAAAARERIEHLEDQLSELKTDLEEARGNSSSTGAELETLREQLAEAEQAAADAETLNARLRETVESGNEQTSVRITELESELEVATRKLEQTAHAASEKLGAERERCEALQARVTELENDTRVETLQKELDDTRRLLEHREHAAEEQATSDRQAIERLGQRVREAEAKAKDAESHAKSSPASDAWSKSRRERLAKQHTLLRAQSKKIKKATDALRDRFEQVEQVLSRRAELAEAYQAVADAEAKITRRETRGNVALLLTSIVIMLAVMGGASWFVSGKVAPGDHAATATLRADAGKRELTPQDTASWHEYMSLQLNDPAFLESVAERLKRRGIESLSTPGALREVVNNSLDTQSPQDGIVEFELRGPGRAKTERVLDTFVVALASAANHARARRTDGATTVVDAPSRVRSDPLDTTRLYTAGGMFGGGALGIVVLGTFMWRRMSETKAKFESDAKVEMILDESNWSDPRKGV